MLQFVNGFHKLHIVNSFHYIDKQIFPIFESLHRFRNLNEYISLRYSRVTKVVMNQYQTPARFPEGIQLRNKEPFVTVCT